MNLTYGDAIPTAFDAEEKDVLSGDTLTYTLSCDAKDGAAVGEYPIKISFNEDDNPNYTVTATDGKLTVGKKSITITANSAVFTYNGTAQSDPGYTVEGLVGNDAVEAVVSGSITFPSESPVKNQVTSYSFTAGSADNYTVTTADGVLTVNKAAVGITITAASGEWVYDGKEHTNSAVTLTGTLFPGDELTAEAEGSVKDVKDTADGNNPVKSGYTVKHGGEDVTENYIITPVAGTLSITPKSASVTVDAGQGKIYGEIDPALTATVEGAVGEEKLNYELSREKGEDVGDYAITVREGDNPNYTVAATPGTFTVSPLSGVIVTVTGKTNETVYDSEKHTVTGYDTAASSPLYDTETDVAFDGKAEASRTEVGTTNMGLTADQFRNVNKNFTDVTFSVTDGFQTITEADKSELNRIIDDSEKFSDLIGDKYPEIAERLDEAIDEAKAVAKDPNVTVEEVKAAADALEKALKAAKDLASDKDEFEKVKAKAIAKIHALLEPGDGVECVNLINRAVNTIRSLPYDEDKTLEDNIEEILDIVSDLERALATERKREYEFNRSVEAALRQGRELQERLKAEEAARKAAEEEAARKAAIPFTDVPADLEPVVRFVYENGIMNGTSSTEFTPFGTLTRGMIVTILYRMEGEPATIYSGTFSDVPAGEWYTPGVERAAANKIVLGFGDGTFGPTKPVTREQLAAILYRYAQFKEYPLDPVSLVSFVTGDVSPWAEEYAAWALSNRILPLDETGSVRGPSPALRWEVAAAVRAFLEAYGR